MAQNKKFEEQEYLNSFLSTSIGKKWMDNYNLKSYENFERPDFIFLSEDNRKIGLEVTRYMVKSKHRCALQHLMTIGNQICHYSKKKYNFDISIIIDKWDKRVWQAKTYKDIMEACYNPGFIEIFDKREVKTKLQQIIDIRLNDLKNWPRLIKESILVQNEYLNITVSGFPNINGKYECSVNNSCFSKEDPFEELQAEIDKKNKNYSVYTQNCVKCFLLIYKPNVSKGNYYHFTRKLYRQKFISKFSDIFLYDEQENLCIKLAT